MEKGAKLLSVSIVVIIFLFIGAGFSYGQEEYPNKPVTLLVPYEPGGNSDIISRIISETVKKYFPQPLVVVNRPGASGTASTLELVNSKPDGYTIQFTASSEGASSLHTIPARYTIDSYTVICRVGSLPVTLSTKGSWKSLKEFIDYARANPGKVRAGVPGLGTVVRLTGERFANQAGLKLLVVPFQGTGPLLPAVLGGHVEIAFMGVTDAVSQYKAGDLRVLTVFADKRPKIMSEVPTAKEQGVNVSGGAFHFIIVPNGVPKPVRDRLDSLMRKVFEDPDFQKKTGEMGYNVDYEDSETAKAEIRNWFKISGDLYEMLGMKKK